VKAKVVCANAALSSVLDQVDKAQGQWPQVADIFHVITDIAHEKRVKIRGGPSISKAIDLVADAHGLPGRSQLSAVWSKFHDVAHLLTAGAYLAHCGLERGNKGAASILSAILFVPDIVAVKDIRSGEVSQAEGDLHLIVGSEVDGILQGISIPLIERRHFPIPTQDMQEFQVDVDGVVQRSRYARSRRRRGVASRLPCADRTTCR